ncbi:MAG: 4-(cytidine 5'-diphospho)-2-C-methyl-D-erythritol kinase [Spirochaetaceae bacterium]|nr:4-(cytidine 5'-diphospho)-2-C-methyl-D-erythritol kinase [Spirochaetaceae bacterium]
MVKSAIINSPAKINLHLDIFNRREDGFHELFSIFQMISLCDKIRISEKGVSGGCEINGPFDFPVEENIMYKAVSLFRKETGYTKGVGIHIEKNIPQGGGLGGGSGNAASVLKALQVLSGVTLGKSTALHIAEQLGSDVPFFLSSPAEIVTGRGENLKSVRARTDYQIILIIPDFSINTAQAFKSLSEYRRGHRAEFPLTKEQVIEMYEKKPVSQWNFYNSFLNCLKKEHNVLEHIVNLFYYSGADFAGMSGSGSVMYGIFSKQKDCIKASEKLSKTFGKMLFANPLDTVTEAALQFS